MIKQISGLGHVQVTGNNAFAPYINMSNPSSGMVRYNGNVQQLEVYDGSIWIQFTADHAYVDLIPSANEVISWAMKKMAEEMELEKLSNSHPAVKAAYENMKRSAEQLKATIILSKDENTTN